MFVWDERMDLAFNEDYHKGKKEGIKEGKLETQKEIVKNLYNNKVSLDIISKSLGISKEEIEKIIND